MSKPMHDPDEGSETPLVPTMYLCTMQIIAGALIAGVSSFFLIVLYIRFGQANPPPAQANLPVVTFVFCVFWLGAVTMSFVVPRIMTRQKRLREILAGTWMLLRGIRFPATRSPPSC